MITEDGSITLYNEQIGEYYHSTHGAIQESMHIFIKDGFYECKKDEIHILEMGFGTGLNAFLTLLEAEKTNKKIYYHTVELYPITLEQVTALNYAEILAPEKKDILLKLHEAKWGENSKICSNFEIVKINSDFCSLDLKDYMFDVVYYDAFSPEKQPELWSLEIFEKIFSHCNSGAIHSCSGATTIKVTPKIVSGRVVKISSLRVVPSAICASKNTCAPSERPIQLR